MENKEPYVNKELAEKFGISDKANDSHTQPFRHNPPRRYKVMTRKNAKTKHSLKSPPQKKRSYKKLIIIASIIAAIYLYAPVSNAVIVFNGEHRASASIKYIANHSGFNFGGKVLFYKANPELVDADSLDTKCPGTDESSVEFGCYLPNENKIYILAVSDSSYKEIEYTTAAHETLHAAWNNLDDYTKGQITSLMKQFYDDKANPQAAKLTDELKSYGKDEAVIDSELHSFIGSEVTVADINSQLSDYYSKYFSDQTAPVLANEQFNNDIDANISNLNDKYDSLNNLSDTIDTYKAQHLDNIKAAMARADYYGDVYSYNQNVDAFNHNLIYYNSQIDSFNSQRDRYNNEVDSFNAVLKTFYPTRTQLKLFSQ